MSTQTIVTPNFEAAMYSLRYEGQTNQFLYYYTTAETLYKILDNRCIKTSKYNSVNDLDEANLDCLNGNLKTWEVEKYINDNCHFISFVYDYIKIKVIIEGLQHPRMWAQYANNSEGACIIINKKKFLNKCRRARGNRNVLLGKVRYTWSKLSQERPEIVSSFCQNSTAEMIVRKYRNKTFFTKHVDWEQEHEKRLCIIGNREQDMISIDGCIEGICLGKNFINDSSRIVKLAETIIDSNDKYSDKLTDAAFGIVTSTESGYDSWPFHPNIDIEIGKIIKSLKVLQINGG